MRSKRSQALLDWLSRDHLTGLRASWPAQSQLKGRVERLGQGGKKGLSLGQRALVLGSLVLLSLAGCFYWQNSAGVQAPMTEAEARVVFEEALKSKDSQWIRSDNFLQALQILGPIDDSIPTFFPLDEDIFELMHTNKSGVTKEGVPYLGLWTNFKAPLGSPVYAMGSGKVVYTSKIPLQGHSLILDHGNGIHSSYEILDQGLTLETGKEVAKGQMIGRVGQIENQNYPGLRVQVHILKEPAETVPFYYIGEFSDLFLQSKDGPLDEFHPRFSQRQRILDEYIFMLDQIERGFPDIDPRFAQHYQEKPRSYFEIKVIELQESIARLQQIIQDEGRNDENQA
jgi:hypothetical protein